MHPDKLPSKFLAYLAQQELPPGGRLPTLSAISAELGISVGKLREEIGLARALQLVSLRPRVGMQREAFDFQAVVQPAIQFGLSTGEATFQQLSQLRRGLELSLWDEAVRRLQPADMARLRSLIDQARASLQAIRIPYDEHRDLHMAIFSRLENPFVTGLLEAYWTAYAASEITRYMSYQYWLEVWDYHDAIVTALENGLFDHGRELLIEHFNLLKTTPAMAADPTRALIGANEL